MEGRLEKRLSRPWGAAWTERELRIRGTQLEVETKHGGLKKYNLREVDIVDKGRHSIALTEKGHVRLTLAAKTKFEHRRWMDALDSAKKKATKNLWRRRTAAFSTGGENDSSDDEPQPLADGPTHASFEVMLAPSSLQVATSGAPILTAGEEPLRIGDEIVGIGDSLFVDADNIENGAPVDGDAVRRALATSADHIVVFRRSLFSVPEKKPAPEKKQPEKKQPEETKPEEKKPPSKNALLEDLLKSRQQPTTAPKKEEPDDLDKENDELVKYLKMAKYGALPEGILAKARSESVSEAGLTKLASLLHLEEEEVTVVKKKRNKTPPRPPSKYRGVHWEPNKDQAARYKRGSLWERRNRNKRESLGERAETLFDENSEALQIVDVLLSAHKEKPQKPVKEEVREEPQVQQRKPVELLDRQKALNLGIALRSVKKDLGAGDLDGLASLAEQRSEMLSSNTLHALLENLPAEDEIGRIQQKKLPNGKYTPTTNFILEVPPNFKRWLEACLTLKETETDAATAVEAARNVMIACREVRSSKELRAALLSALALGNKLNADTARGSAYAIKLQDLDRLEHTKGPTGANGYDVLAQVLELDKKRGDDGLDAARIDAVLRDLRPVLRDTDATREHTFDVATKLQTRVTALKRNFLTGGDSPFVSRCVDKIDALDASIASLRGVLAQLDLEQHILADWTDEPDTPLHTVFASLLNFANLLIASREAKYGPPSSSGGWWWS